MASLSRRSGGEEGERAEESKETAATALVVQSRSGRWCGAPACSNSECGWCRRREPPVLPVAESILTWHADPSNSDDMPPPPCRPLPLCCGPEQEVVEFRADWFQTDAAQGMTVDKDVQVQTLVDELLGANAVVDGFHMLPVRMDVRYSTANLLAPLAVKFTTFTPGTTTAGVKRTVWFPEQVYGHGAEPHGLVLPPGTNSQGEYTRIMTLAPNCSPLVAQLAGIDLNALETSVGALVENTTVQIPATDKGGVPEFNYNNELHWLIAYTFPKHALTGNSVHFIVTREAKMTLQQKIKELRDRVNKSSVMLSLGKIDSGKLLTSSRPKFTFTCEIPSLHALHVANDEGLPPPYARASASVSLRITFFRLR